MKNTKLINDTLALAVAIEFIARTTHACIGNDLSPNKDGETLTQQTIKRIAYENLRTKLIEED